MVRASRRHRARPQPWRSPAMGRPQLHGLTQGQPPAMRALPGPRRISARGRLARGTRAGSRATTLRQKSAKRLRVGEAIGTFPSPGLRCLFWAYGARGMGVGVRMAGMRGAQPGDLRNAAFWAVPARDKARFPWGPSTRSCRRHWGLSEQQAGRAEGEAWGPARAITAQPMGRPPRLYCKAGAEAWKSQTLKSGRKKPCSQQPWFQPPVRLVPSGQIGRPLLWPHWTAE